MVSHPFTLARYQYKQDGRSGLRKKGTDYSEDARGRSHDHSIRGSHSTLGTH